MTHYSIAPPFPQLLVLAAVDVEANYVVVKAYQYTTFTSAQLLDCFSIPMVMLLSRILLGARYSRLHLVGVALCLAGMGGVVASDHFAPNGTGGGDGTGEPSGEDQLIGDLLCLVAATLYAGSNVGEEYFVRAIDKTALLGYLGLFGALINGAQFAALEGRAVAELEFGSLV